MTAPFSLTFDGIHKRDFFFPDDARPDPDAAIGSTLRLTALDESRRLGELVFRVTRNTFFPLSETRWIYGSIPYGERGVAQVEIRLHGRDPRLDTIEIFPYAPPIL
jgi:hypothetical protein